MENVEYEKKDKGNIYDGVPTEGATDGVSDSVIVVILPEIMAESVPLESLGWGLTAGSGVSREIHLVFTLGENGLGKTRHSGSDALVIESISGDIVSQPFMLGGRARNRTNIDQRESNRKPVG